MVVALALPLPEAALVPVGTVEESVTPTAAQLSCANCTAAARSDAFVQVDSMHCVVLSMKAWLLQRQALSVAEQLPVLAWEMQVRAHSVQ